MQPLLGEKEVNRGLLRLTAECLWVVAHHLAGFHLVLELRDLL